MLRKVFVICLLLPFVTIAQNKQIAVEDIFVKGTFRGENIRPDFGQTAKDPLIDFKELKDEAGKPFGEPEDVIYSELFPNIVLIRKGIEPIYRHSNKAFLYLYDARNKKLTKLSDEKMLHPTLSPDGSNIAFVENNNLYVYNIVSKTKKAVTTDGKWNEVINGNCDWVYEEEFSFTQAYQWSPKGNYLAYYRFDEGKVKEYQFTQYDNAYNKQYVYKYPKAGEDNSKVEIHLYDMATGNDVKAQYEQGDIYIPRIKWTQNDKQLIVFWMNRHQNNLKLLSTDAQTGASNLLYEEKNKYYIDITDDWKWLKDGKNFVFTSEMNGFNHIYLYGEDGKSKVQISKGNFDVAEINGIDEINKRVYYTAAFPRPMDRNLFVTDFSGKKTVQLTQGEAWHRTVLNDSFTQFYDYASTLITAQSTALYDVVLDKKKNISAKLVKTIGNNSKLKATVEDYDFGNALFIKVPNSKGDTLNGWMLKPKDFDPAKKYPVLFCNYGGPGSQTVANRFGSVSAWHQLLAQKGFIVVSVDNTGTGFRGQEFKKKTYLQLGKFEIEDQIDAAKFIGNMPFVDKQNIGHWGWSYGGFMSSLAITKGNSVFSGAVAVAPVTNWRFYDNIYTERYMRTPQENQGGYDNNSPINFTDSIKGKYIIIHGTADDNVHFQNATQMISALIKSNIDFESAYYPNKNHGMSGGENNSSYYHVYKKMTKWILENLGNENTKSAVGEVKKTKGF